MPGSATRRPRPHDELRIVAAYEAHGAELYRFALRGLGDDGAAQDAVQEVFLRAWRAAARFDPALASVRVWLFAIARNVVVDHVRRAGVRPVAATELTELAERRLPQQPRFDEAATDSWLVAQALRRLPDEHRSALVETYLRGRPHAEVAAEQGIPVGTLRSRVFYGLRALRRAMAELGVEP